jgi:hypothetical protein
MARAKGDGGLAIGADALCPGEANAVIWPLFVTATGSPGRLLVVDWSVDWNPEVGTRPKVQPAAHAAAIANKILTRSPGNCRKAMRNPHQTSPNAKNQRRWRSFSVILDNP